MVIGPIENHLKSELKRKKALIFILIDSEVSQNSQAITLAKKVEKIGASAVLVGGSSATDQIEIILNQKDISQTEFHITKGAYYRQVSQSRHKLMALFYSISLLRGLGILSPNDIDVMLKLSENIAVIKDGDVFPEKEEQVMGVIYRLIHQSCKL